MSEDQRQRLIDINNISCSLSDEDAKKIELVAVSLLNISLLQVLPDLELSELEELDTTEKLMLLKEYSKSKEQREKELEEAITFEEILKKEGLSRNKKLQVKARNSDSDKIYIF